ncbi:MAG TPA: SRPBCC family protein [Chthoniobacterales bacterium]
MKIFLRLVILLILLVVTAYLIGSAIPAHQTHTRVITVRQTPENVFALLSDLPNFPKWNRNTVKLEMLPPIEGKEATRQTFKGNLVMTIVTSESTPPTRLVRSMGDNRGPFEGSWTYEISRTADGSQIVLTERSTMKNPLYRLMRKMFGPTKYMDEHLQDIAKNFGETTAVH